MKATYNDFISANPNCSNYADNKDAQRIFKFLNQDENIIKMIEFADQGKPALAGCVFELEAFFDAMNSKEIDFNDTMFAPLKSSSINLICSIGFIPNLAVYSFSQKSSWFSSRVK